MPKTEDKFSLFYQNLNTKQKEAVDAIEGPVMVVAGPGTGKTQILTLRIANILKQTDTAPENILALTFTENASANMRKRLAELVGPAAYRVVISTFHSFCNDIIKNYPEEFPRIIGSTSITEIDQIKIIENLIDTLELDLLRPYGDPFLYTKDILVAINSLKREGLSPEEFSDLVSKEENNFEHIADLRHDKGAYKGKIKSVYEKLKKQIDKNKELSKIYQAYEKDLNKSNKYDYSDMIMEVLNALKVNKNLLLSLQENHQYILVDEHQDTNNAQNKILELIASFHDNPNLFVVGDEKQAIFRFQGASLENFYYFKDLYPKAKLITLGDNYRSTQAILDTAWQLLSGQKLNANTALKSEPIYLAELGTAEEEMFFVTSEIKSKIEAGVQPDNIAVLYRDNKDSLPLSRLMAKMEVPFVVESDEDLLSNIDVRKLILLLRTIDNFGNDEILGEALHLDFLKIQPLDAHKLIRLSAESRKSLFDLIKNPPTDLDLEDRESIQNLFSKLSAWRTKSKNEELLPFIESVLKESGFLDDILRSPDVKKRIEVISGLFGDIKQEVESHPEARLQDFLDFIDTIRKYKVLLKKPKSHFYKNHVHLMTVHKSKGLEFEYVYIIGAYNGHFGARSSRDRLKILPTVYQLGASAPDTKSDTVSDDDGDERRLFYVALTRAKKGVTITWAKTSDSGREQIPSKFVEEIRSDIIKKVDTTKAEQDYQANKYIFISPQKETQVDIYDASFVKEKFLDQGLSVTHLNNYLECPWKYFYRNLVRLPEAPAKHQAFGIAIHNALSDVFRTAKEKDITKESLLASFERYLHKQFLLPRDLEESLKRGRDFLSGWYDTYHSTWNVNVLTEFKIDHIYLTDDIHINGNLDKIEINDGGVNVVDYKTGKVKTKNELLGKTQNSSGDYYRQLVFYKLLLDLFDGGKYKMLSAEVDFIAPTDSGKYKKEKFIIEQEEVDGLKKTIEQVADEIMALSFWNKKCEDRDCEYCALRSLMDN